LIQDFNYKKNEKNLPKQNKRINPKIKIIREEITFFSSHSIFLFCRID